jgi:hypothetical protein
MANGKNGCVRKTFEGAVMTRTSSFLLADPVDVMMVPDPGTDLSVVVWYKQNQIHEVDSVLSILFWHVRGNE